MEEESIQKVSLECTVDTLCLSEIIPFLRLYNDKVVVVKIGGEIMQSPDIMPYLARDLIFMKQCNVHPVIVHGGGRQIDSMLSRLGIESRFEGGLRVTVQEAVEVVEMVLCGSLNRMVVQEINQHGGIAVGLSGKDGKMMYAEAYCNSAGGDLGHVGVPASVNTSLVMHLVREGFIPVIAPIAADESGKTYNINADTAAGTIASHLGAARLLLMTSVNGVTDHEGRVYSSLSENEVEVLIAQNIITGGMIPKVQTALHALREGVDGVAILNGLTKNALLLELFTKYGTGTLIKGDVHGK